MVRLKNRYLLVNILYPELEKGQSNSGVPDVVVFNQPTTDQLSQQALLKGIREHITVLFGDYGRGATSERLAIKYFSTATSTFIVRVARDHYKLVWAALSMMNSVPINDGKNCVFRVVRVSGTIKKAEEEAIRRARELILKAQRDLGSQHKSILDDMFGGNGKKDASHDVLMVDRDDSDSEGVDSDGDG